jgi:hypothetical protein
MYIKKDKIFITLVSIGLWLINFFHYSNKEYLFRTAKGFGLNLRVWTMFLYFTMCRSLLHGKIENHKSLHKYIGYIVTVSSIGHTLCHLLRTGFLTTNIYITGYTLFTIITLIFITFLTRNYNFSIFKFTHMLYYPWLIICILHMKIHLYWFLIPIIVFTVEHLLNLNKIQISEINNYEIIENENLKPIIYLPVPKKIESVPGSYYYLFIPSCGIEWHPYSVANTSISNQLLFLIEVKGDWSIKLFKRLKNKNSTKIIVMGPYFTPSVNVLNNDYVEKLCICTGVGITPFLSIIDTKIDSTSVNREFRRIHAIVFDSKFKQVKATKLTEVFDIENTELVDYKKQNLKVIWIFRDISSIENLFIYIAETMKYSSNVTLDIYITSKSESVDKFINNNKNRINITLHKGRPLFFEIIPKFDVVYYCGNPTVKNSIKEFCEGVKIPMYSEIFS